ncbi:hypothetical protein [Dongia mobilis]|jgi:hypothetical protein|uniref:hypothetical protein n=1 Tax=Dongia sp. TaxID=1977262 RepID=UPI0026EC160C
MRRFYESIDRDFRLKTIGWGFLLIGIYAVAVDQLPLIWAAWLGATVSGIAAVRRRWLYGAFVILFMIVCILVYRALDLWLAPTNFGSLPHAQDFPHVIPVAGIIMETLFALFALDGRYQARHDDWAERLPFSRNYIQSELRRRDTERDAPRRDQSIDAP